MCHSAKEEKAYVLEEILKEIAPQHRILRTPPYHFEYNAIELIWGIAKPKYDNRIGKDNKFSEKAATDTWAEVLTEITPKMWEDCVLKTEARILTDYLKEVKNTKPSTARSLFPDSISNGDVSFYHSVFYSTLIIVIIIIV